MKCDSTGLTGGNYCTKGNPEGVPTGIAFAKTGFSMTESSFLLEATLTAAVKAENFFPINGSDLFKGFENNNAESKIHEHPNGSRSFMQQKVLRFAVILDPNEEQEKQLKKFHNTSHDVFLFYDTIIRGRTPDSGVTIKGLRTSLIFVETGDFNMADGTFGTMKISVDILTEKDKSEYAYSREVEWELFNLDGLTGVDLEQNGVPTATSIVIDIFAESNGVQTAIQALTKDDFAITGTGSITSTAESETIPGEYTFVTEGLVNGDTIDLVSPATISVSDYYIKSLAPVTVSGIVAG